MASEHMNRRSFVTLLGGAAAACPLAARAQQSGKVHRIGFLWENANTLPDALETFRQELRRLGYIDGANLIIEFRWAEGDPGRMRELAEELPVDVIVAPSSVYTAAAKQATSTIPIVFMSHADPPRTWHVASLARYGPKQHVTAGGLMSYSPDRADLWRRGAGYVDKVLRGVKPAELPVQQPTKYELVINLKTAKALGLEVPHTLLARADEVIE
jgi:ABC-type uncharacterized transport system substrate-binding protein